MINQITGSGSSSSVKGRIAGKLGLIRPPKGRTIPLQKGAGASGWSERSNGNRPTDVRPFTLLGRRNDLYEFAE